MAEKVKKLIYVGRRRFKDGLAPAFIERLNVNFDQLPNGAPLVFYRGCKFLRIGDVYQTHDDTIKRTPESLGRHSRVTDEIIEGWELLETAAEQWDAQRRAANRAKNYKFEGKTLRDIARAAAKLSWTDRQAIGERIVALIMKGEK